MLSTLLSLIIDMKDLPHEEDNLFGFDEAYTLTV
jgi:hypothetical protein